MAKTVPTTPAATTATIDELLKPAFFTAEQAKMAKATNVITAPAPKFDVTGDGLMFS